MKVMLLMIKPILMNILILMMLMTKMIGAGRCKDEWVQ